MVAPRGGVSHSPSTDETLAVESVFSPPTEGAAAALGNGRKAALDNEMAEKPMRTTEAADVGSSRARHWAGFLFSGALAFTVDAVTMELGIRLLGLPILLARLIAISTAMVVAWLAHRRLTFALDTRPSMREFIRYAAAAWVTSGINYGAFAFILLVHPDISRILALVVSSILATIFAYLSMRYGVFRRSRK